MVPNGFTTVRLQSTESDDVTTPDHDLTVVEIEVLDD
jgi:hypothetical protein